MIQQLVDALQPVTTSWVLWHGKSVILTWENGYELVILGKCNLGGAWYCQNPTIARPLS